MRRLVELFFIVSGIVAVSAAAQPQRPPFERAPDALERVTWRTRTLVGDDKLTRWKFAIPADGVAVATFLDAVVRADAAIVDFVEGSSAQVISASMPKTLDAELTAEERASVRARMGSVKLLTYRIDDLPAGAAAQRKLFEFAKAMGVDTLVTGTAARADWAAIDALANETGVNVAVMVGQAKPADAIKALAGRSKRLGVGIDTGTAARDGLTIVKDRLLYVRLQGKSIGGLTPFFHDLDRLNVRPLAMTLDTAGVVSAPGDLFAAVSAFEDAVQPAYGAHFTEFSKTRPIRWDVSDDVRQRIESSIPRQPYATPRKKRKLLVIESLQGMSHNTIPHTNVMLERMGAITGAWETEFSNDLTNLKYPKITQYDGIFLNSIVGEFAAEPAVREGLSRFVREGGGMAGIHGTPWASRNWNEFADMIGAQSTPHRIEQGVMKVYDRSSPIMKPFQEKDLKFAEEYYRFQTEGQGRLRWDQIRVLMTVELDDPKVEPRPWTGYKRPDNIYPVSWIRSYGKGRVFYSSLGHMPETFMSPEIVGHLFAGLQFVLGDLDADTTPNPHK
jgi:type 1 glutamine amidotransferase